MITTWDAQRDGEKAVAGFCQCQRRRPSFLRTYVSDILYIQSQQPRQLPRLLPRGVVGRGRCPHFFDSGDASPIPPLFGLKFVQKLVHCCNWLLTETQCKNFFPSVVLGVPHFFFRTTPPASLSPRSSLTTSSPLKPSSSAQPSHCSPSFFSSALTTRIPRGLFTDACYHNVFFYFLVFSVFHFLVVGSVR